MQNPDINVNIISFTVPYPPNYGGCIDVFYKIKALKKIGVNIILHCFYYDRKPTEELKQYCKSVFFYKRKVGIKSNLSFLPYIIKSRQSDELIANLLTNDYPIIFEGLHSCYYLNDKRLKNRCKIYRESNIEHEYYFNLFKSAHVFSKKIYYLVESLRLLIFQKTVAYADFILPVSVKDFDYLKRKFSHNKIVYMPSFHGNDDVISQLGRGAFGLYNGNLSVDENINAAKYLMSNIFSKMPEYRFVITGLNPDNVIYKMALKYDNVKIIANPDDMEMNRLISDAQVNILYTEQATGLKLKLLNVLYRGRFVLVNSKMCAGTGLDDLCIIADDDASMIEKLKIIFDDYFTENEINRRRMMLSQCYCDAQNANSLVEIITSWHVS